MYLWHEELYMQDGDNVHHIRQIDVRELHIDLVGLMPNIVFRFKDVELIEKDHPHYRAVRFDSNDIEDITFTTDNNISTVIPVMLYIKNSMFGLPLGDKTRNLDNEMMGILDETLRRNNIKKLNIDRIYPQFIRKHEDHKPLTTLELAQEFLKMLPPKSRCDKFLALLEIDKRFPGLSHDQIAILFPPPREPSDAESFTKHAYRMRKEARKYQKIIF